MSNLERSWRKISSTCFQTLTPLSAGKVNESQVNLPSQSLPVPSMCPSKKQHQETHGRKVLDVIVVWSGDRWDRFSFPWGQSRDQISLRNAHQKIPSMKTTRNTPTTHEAPQTLQELCSGCLWARSTKIIWAKMNKLKLSPFTKIMLVPLIMTPTDGWNKRKCSSDRTLYFRGFKQFLVWMVETIFCFPIDFATIFTRRIQTNIAHKSSHAVKHQNTQWALKKIWTGDVSHMFIDGENDSKSCKRSSTGVQP